MILILFLKRRMSNKSAHPVFFILSVFFASSCVPSRFPLPFIAIAFSHFLSFPQDPLRRLYGCNPIPLFPTFDFRCALGEDHLLSWELVLGLFTDFKADGIKKKKTGIWEMYDADVMIFKNAKRIWFYTALFKSTDSTPRLRSHGEPDWPRSYFSPQVI